MSVTIRHAEPDDARALHTILTSPHVVKGTMRLPYMALKNTEDRLIPDPKTLQLVAETDDGVAGFAELLLNSDCLRAAHSAELNMVAVRAQDQGKGIARSLIEEIIRLCDTYMGIRRLSLTVWTDNVRAIALYEALGFEKEGLLRDFVKSERGYDDAVKMARINKNY